MALVSPLLFTFLWKGQRYLAIKHNLLSGAETRFESHSNLTNVQLQDIDSISSVDYNYNCSSGHQFDYGYDYTDVA